MCYKNGSPLAEEREAGIYWAVGGGGGGGGGGGAVHFSAEKESVAAQTVEGFPVIPQLSSLQVTLKGRHWSYGMTSWPM